MSTGGIISRWLIAIILAALLTFEGRLMAQAARPAGLDALGDDALLTELAGRGLDDLLDQVFDADRTPADRRSVIRDIGALQRLSTDKTISDARREQILNRVAAGADSLIRAFGNDPELLTREARTIAEQGVDPQTGVLEYWGDSDAEKAHLRPLAQAAVQLYDQASKQATAQATDIANRLTGPDDKLADTWRKTSDLAGAANYQKARMQYALALSMDVADGNRDPLIDDAIKTLSQWDNADSGIQPQVRLILAKLHAMRGGRDELVTAAQMVDSLLNSHANQIAPEPTPQLLLEARLYGVIVRLLAGDAATANSALADAATYQQAHFANDRDLEAAIRLLNYRLAALQADQSPAGADRNAANASAVQQLTQLLTDFPGLQKEIYRQLVRRIPTSADMKQLDPLFLRALVDQGLRQILSATPDQIADKSTIRKSLDAALEIMSRFAAGTIPAQQAIEPSLYLGFFQEYLGDKAGAINSLLDHIQRFGKEPAAKAAVALDRAQTLIADLRQAAPAGKIDAQVQQLQDRFLPVAINPPFNRREFALQYAASLYQQRKWNEAIHYYQLVPDTEPPARRLTAQYGEMAATKYLLEESPNAHAENKQQLVGQIQKLAEAVRGISTDIIKSQASEADKAHARSTLARTSLVAADLTRREQKDPRRVLELLAGFEDSVQGLSDSKTLLASALFLRVQAYMQLGQNDQATQTLVQYLNTAGGNEGADTVKQLLSTLDDELDKAREQSGSGTEASIRQLTANRALLSGFLVKWATENDDTKIHRLAYIYQRFDADTQFDAAVADASAESRQRGLAAALERYKQLQSPQNVTLYQASLDPTGNVDKNYPDPLVTLGIGRTAYELHDCQTVKDTLGQLIHDEKLGENTDEYWEATYKLLDCMHALAKSGDANTTDAQVQQALKVQYLIWRDGTGGKKWHDKFDALRKAVLPDWTPPASATNPAG
ncbi:MAG: hypothetical protein M3O30_04330 [Planctomycetota bacterium]|nr:hypothetical protein [Planctomycetota bacterium]